MRWKSSPFHAGKSRCRSGGSLAAFIKFSIQLHYLARRATHRRSPSTHGRSHFVTDRLPRTTEEVAWLAILHCIEQNSPVLTSPSTSVRHPRVEWEEGLWWSKRPMRPLLEALWRYQNSVKRHVPSRPLLALRIRTPVALSCVTRNGSVLARY